METNIAMGTNNKEIGESKGQAIHQEMLEDKVKGAQNVPVGPIHKLITENAKSISLVIKKTRVVIPPHIIAEAISTIRDIGLRWSGPITQKEMEFVEQYVLAKYPEYAGLIEENGSGIIDISSFIVNEDPSETISDDRKKLPKEPFFGINLPEMDRTQLEPSRLLDILNKKSSFPGSFISIPEIQAQNKVLKHCGLPDDEYLVVYFRL